MALLYKMRALAVSDNDYVFWTDSEPDLDGTNAPEAVVTASIVVAPLSRARRCSGKGSFG